MKKHLFIFPFFGKGESTAVGAYRISLCKGGVRLFGFLRDMGRIDFERISRANVYGCSETIYLPVGRNRKADPSRIIKIIAVKLFGPLLRGGYPVKLPRAVQRKRSVVLHPKVRRKGSPCTLSVYLQHMLVFPVSLAKTGNRNE